ncbi:hypothetical protein OG225_32280 [Nocardia sp. NBC_01377]|uniref:hypothetical protein n=1 Tax=Nocardia sp. NBC_01377 TaxID=2903595 RepID=UPI003250B193
MSRAVFAVVTYGSIDAVADVPHRRAISPTNVARCATSIGPRAWGGILLVCCAADRSQVTGVL